MKLVVIAIGFLFVVACGSVKQPVLEQKQGRAITIYEDPSLSDTLIGSQILFYIEPTGDYSLKT